MQSVLEVFQSSFGGYPRVVARAPGRVEFIGNHTDYNGGLVLGAAIDRTLSVALRPNGTSTIRAVSAGHGGVVTFQPGDIPEGSWAAYPAGVIAVLAGMTDLDGCDLAFHTDLPVGAGLSSSAAIEMSTAFAIDAWLELGYDRASLVRIGQRAENEHVGVPCGILDQAVVTFGKADHLVLVDAGVSRFDAIGIPGETRLWLFDSGVRHRLSDGHYAERHEECRAAYRILQAHQNGVTSLADIDPETVEAARSQLPERLYRRALHITREDRRVRSVVAHLEAGRLREAGSELFASHASSRDDFANSVPELDLLVERLSQEPSVLGARLTGGGWGGAVLAWTDLAFGVREADAVSRLFEARHGRRPTVIACRAADGVTVELY